MIASHQDRDPSFTVTTLCIELVGRPVRLERGPTSSEFADPPVSPTRYR